MKIQSLYKLAVLALVSTSSLLNLQSQTLLLEYEFNDSGTTTTSTGSLPTVATMVNSGTTPTDLHGAAGSGVSGQSWDLAFNNTASTGMGSAGTGGGVSVGDLDAVDGLSSFTLQGWFNSSTAIGGVARLFEKNAGAGTSGFVLRADTTAGQLVLQVDNIAVTSSAAFGATNEWTFFAVSYDGTLTTNNVNFYLGDTTDAVSLVGTYTLNSGVVNANSVPIVLGNNTSLTGFTNIRPYDGYLDNMRVYGETTGAGGVLTLSQLEAVRAADLVPEPTVSMLLIGAGLVTVVFRRRHNRSI
jgi:hypothetical protein